MSIQKFSLYTRFPAKLNYVKYIYLLILKEITTNKNLPHFFGIFRYIEEKNFVKPKAL